MTRNEFRAQAIALPRDSVDSVLATNKVIRNTYLLLSLTLAFAAVVAGDQNVAAQCLAILFDQRILAGDGQICADQ